MSNTLFDAAPDVIDALLSRGYKRARLHGLDQLERPGDGTLLRLDQAAEELGALVYAERTDILSTPSLPSPIPAAVPELAPKRSRRTTVAKPPNDILAPPPARNRPPADDESVLFGISRKLAAMEPAARALALTYLNAKFAWRDETVPPASGKLPTGAGEVAP